MPHVSTLPRDNSEHIELSFTNSFYLARVIELFRFVVDCQISFDFVNDISSLSDEWYNALIAKYGESIDHEDVATALLDMV